MNVICTKCDQKIDSQNINVAKDIAYCPSCEVVTKLSALVDSSSNKKFNVLTRVKGIKTVDEGYRWSVEASNRSVMALFLVPFTAVWAGGSLSGIYGTQIVSGEFNLEQSLFGLPFLIGSIFLISFTLMTIFGRTVVSCENGRGLIFVGIGAVGWYRRFDWNSIDKVEEVHTRKNRHLSLEGARRLNFGWGLNSEKTYYLANFLRMKLDR